MQRLVRTLIAAAVLVPAIILGSVSAQEPPPTTTTTTTTTTTIPPSLPYLEQFETEEWHDTWIDWRFLDEQNTRIATGYVENGLEVVIPPNLRRGAGPLYPVPGDNIDEAWFRYRIRLDDFLPIASGKLPGFAGMPNFTARGCNPSTAEYPGWSARMLFNAAGVTTTAPDNIRVGYYVYHLDQPGSCGEFMQWNDSGVFAQDWWYCVEGRVKLNTPGLADGVLEGWVDNQPAFSRSDLRFRRTAEDWLDVRTFWLNLYFGGSTIPNDRDLTLRIDDLALSETRLGCPNRFADDDGNPHEDNIEWMFQNGYVYGCKLDSYCPDRQLTRGHIAALLDRILQPATTGTDYFGDDDGHWAEGPIDRLAAIGVLRGCEPVMACPNRPVTRAQIAAFLTRAFDLPPSAQNFFTDDDHTVFAADIDAIAALDITRGCDLEGHFCPWDPVYRDQAATLFARTVRWWRTG